jgi:hypothetical protein
VLGKARQSYMTAGCLLRGLYRDAAFRNYLAHQIGGQELGRLDDVRAALTESFEVIQQLLGTPGARTPPESPPDRT